MDPICHTLVGAALGCTGLERRTRYGRATLIIAANLPDIDVVAHSMGGAASYAFRRGVTHGIPALIILPVLLALLMIGWSRMWPGRGSGPPVSFRWLLILSIVGVLTHPTLDWMNTYGMRWLMPIADVWFYGGTLFIIDWVAWLVLLAGLIGTRFVVRDRIRWFQRPASVALAVLVAYIAMNYVITQQAEAATLRALADDPPARLLASPVPLDPFRREVVLEYDDEYRFGTFRLFGGGYTDDDLAVARGDPSTLERARTTTDGRWFLHWARFPYSMSYVADGRERIVIADARYIRDVNNPRIDGFAMLELELFLTGARAAGGGDSQSP